MHFSLRGLPCQAVPVLAECHLLPHSALVTWPPRAVHHLLISCTDLQWTSQNCNLASTPCGLCSDSVTNIIDYSKRSIFHFDDYKYMIVLLITKVCFPCLLLPLLLPCCKFIQVFLALCHLKKYIHIYLFIFIMACLFLHHNKVSAFSPYNLHCIHAVVTIQCKVNIEHRPYLLLSTTDTCHASVKFSTLYSTYWM